MTRRRIRVAGAAALFFGLAACRARLPLDRGALEPSRAVAAARKGTPARPGRWMRAGAREAPPSNLADGTSPLDLDVSPERLRELVRYRPHGPSSFLDRLWIGGCVCVPGEDHR